MTEVAVTTESVTSDVTDAQVGEFFESGGEKAPDAIVEKTTEVVAEPEKKPEPSPIEVELKNIKGALAEERGKRKTEAQKREQMETRFNQMMERLQPQPQVPDVQQDPLGHLLTKVQQLEQQTQRQNENQQQFAQRQQQQAHLAEFDQAYKTQAMTFAQAEPGFQDAYAHLVTERQKAYEAQGIDPAEYAQRLQFDERQVAHLAFSLGMNPGALIYNLAQSSGWKPKAQNVVKQPNMDALAKGTQARSLSGVAGKSQQNLTLEALAEMDDADFDKNWDKLIKG